MTSRSWTWQSPLDGLAEAEPQLLGVPTLGKRLRDAATLSFAMARPERDALWLVDEGIFQPSLDEDARASLEKRTHRLALPAIQWGAHPRWVLARVQIDAGAPRVAAVLGVFSDAPVKRWKTLSAKPAHEGSACLLDEATLHV